MSISAPSLLEASLSQQQQQRQSDTTRTRVATTPIRTPSLRASSSPPSALSTSLASLLRALAAGDVSGARSDLTRVQADLKFQQSSNAIGNAPNGRLLHKLLSQLSEALQSARTGAALQYLATYLVRTGHASGTLVNTTA